MDIKEKNNKISSAVSALVRSLPAYARSNLKSIGAIALFIIVLFLAGRFFGKQADVPPVVESKGTEKNAEAKIESFSRATFFFTQPLKGSLAMPESWEGRYRMTDAGDTVIFSYIGHPRITAELFSVRIYPKNVWDQAADKPGSVIASEKDFVFVYKKSVENPYQGKESDKFQDMLREGDDIISSFKAFGL